MTHPSTKMTITKCLKKLILLGQVFGYFPVLAISSSTQKFSYKSFRMVYSIFSLSGSLCLLVMQLNKVLPSKISIDQFNYIAKYLSGSYVAIVFVELAKKWPQLMVSWRQVEVDMKGYGFPRKLNKQISLLILFFMGTFLVEYILHQATRIFRALECHDQVEKSVKFFFGNLSPYHVLQYIPYNIPATLVFQYWLCQLEFAFIYTDIFVMVISMCLASRMQQLTKRIKLASQNQVANEKVWKNLRKDYTRLGTLVELVNKNISNIILISFLPNIFTILTQVFNALKPKHNWIESVYFNVSLVFLVSRTMMVCICGSMVNEESRKPLHYLNSVHHTIYNEEIDIFINQLLNFEISMNGKNFFDIKRYLILDLAGAILTYELVLIQFNQDSLNSGSKSTRCI